MGIQSTATFGGAFGAQAKTTTVNKLHHKICKPARSVHIVPKVQYSPFSTSKLVEADYVAIYDKQEVNFYDATTTKIVVSEEAVLKGWQCPVTKLWHVPLVDKPDNLNTVTLLLDHPTQLENLNKLYEVQTTKKSRLHICALLAQTNKEEYVHNVYELPSIKQTVQYLHAVAGHPTEDTWLKAIRKGNYNSWPLSDKKKVQKYFPESEETQFGHMRGQHQGVRLTCTTHSTVANTPKKLLEKKNDIFIHIYKLNENNRLTGTLCADQTGDFPHISSHGNRLIMLLHHVDSNSMWVEPLKNQKESTLIAAQMRALEQMRQQEILTKTPNPRQPMPRTNETSYQRNNAV
jgi:hypothetical protein